MTELLFARMARLLGGVTAILIISGCAGIGGDHRGGLDVDRLVNAIAQDDVGYVQSVVRQGAVGINQQIPAPAYSAGAPLVALAARAGAVRVLNFLIVSGADLNARTSVNETPVMLAAYFHGDEGEASTARHDAALRMLVEAGASVENAPNNYTPLSYAAYNNRQFALRYLIERGARVDADAYERQVYVNTPLMMAAMQGHRDVVRLLLRAGADPLIRVRNGSTAREFALKYRHSHVEPLLACAEALPAGARYAQYCEGPRVATSN